MFVTVGVRPKVLLKVGVGVEVGLGQVLIDVIIPPLTYVISRVLKLVI